MGYEIFMVNMKWSIKILPCQKTVFAFMQDDRHIFPQYHHEVFVQAWLRKCHCHSSTSGCPFWYTIYQRVPNKLAQLLVPQNHCIFLGAHTSADFYNIPMQIFQVVSLPMPISSIMEVRRLSWKFADEIDYGTLPIPARRAKLHWVQSGPLQ